MQHASTKKVHNSISYGLRACISLTLFRDTSREYSRIVRQRKKREETEKKKKTCMENIGNVINDGKANAVEGKRSKGIGNVQRHRHRQSVDLVAKPSWQGSEEDEGEGGAREREGAAPLKRRLTVSWQP